MVGYCPGEWHPGDRSQTVACSVKALDGALLASTVCQTVCSGGLKGISCSLLLHLGLLKQDLRTAQRSALLQFGLLKQDLGTAQRSALWGLPVCPGESQMQVQLAVCACGGCVLPA